MDELAHLCDECGHAQGCYMNLLHRTGTAGRSNPVVCQHAHCLEIEVMELPALADGCFESSLVFPLTRAAHESACAVSDIQC